MTAADDVERALRFDFEFATKDVERMGRAAETLGVVRDALNETEHHKLTSPLWTVFDKARTKALAAREQAVLVANSAELRLLKFLERERKPF